VVGVGLEEGLAAPVPDGAQKADATHHKKLNAEKAGGCDEEGDCEAFHFPAPGFL